MKVLTWGAVAAVTIGAMVSFTGPAQAVTLSADVPVPEGVTTGYLLYDRVNQKTITSFQEHKKFRSASLVKIIIGLDHIDQHADGDVDKLPAADLDTMRSMFQRSDDAAAKTFWQGNGRTAVIDRAVAKMALEDTSPPTDVNFWGYTAISAADMLKVYDYVETKAAPKTRAFILDNLRQIKQCAKDNADQYFGVPSALSKPWAVKQGWSAWGDPLPADAQCATPAPKVPSDRRKAAGLSGKEASPSQARKLQSLLGDEEVDLTSPLLHTSALTGPNDDYFIVVLTLQKPGATWTKAAEDITTLTKVVYAQTATARR